jgi:hypothetical protein
VIESDDFFFFASLYRLLLDLWPVTSTHRGAYYTMRMAKDGGVYGSCWSSVVENQCTHPLYKSQAGTAATCTRSVHVPTWRDKGVCPLEGAAATYTRSVHVPT